jgi:hypothetical protein
MMTAATPIAIPSIDKTERSGCPRMAPELSRIRSDVAIVAMDRF